MNEEYLKKIYYTLVAISWQLLMIAIALGLILNK